LDKTIDHRSFVETSNMESITNTIKRFRKERQITQKGMSERLNIARSTYTKLESGNTELNYKTLIQISKVLDVPIVDIIKGNDFVSKTFSKKLEWMLFETDLTLSQTFYEIIPYKDLTLEHKKLLKQKSLDEKERYETSPLGGRIYKYGPKDVFKYMMDALGMSVLFKENMIDDKYWINRWNKHITKANELIEVDEFDYFEVCIFELKMPDCTERWIQIAARDFPEGVADTEETAVKYLKKKTGAIEGTYVCHTLDGYDPVTEIIK
jgi:transcriptional regulator with XRE-family HTH domain